MKIQGAHCLKKLINVQKEFHTQYSSGSPSTQINENQHINRLEVYAEKLTSDAISKIYPENANMPEKLDFSDYEPEGVKNTEKNKKTL